MLPIGRYGKSLRWTARLPSGLVGLWRREFRDARLILEQEGDLRYIVVPGSLQRLAVRTGIATGVVVFTALMGLTGTALYLQTKKVRLEASHHAIYKALVDSTSDLQADGGYSSGEVDLVLLAETIRERDQEIRQMVSAATSSVTESNRELDRHLQASGLTESAIKVIQANTAMGAFTQDRDLDQHPDPLLRGTFAEQSAKNRELKDILQALPAKMPVSDYYTTSHFGIRKHPISGRPRFHAGVDLVTRSDDRVYPVRSGKVILARYYNNYGNTVIVRHERGIETLYAHLERIDVQEGQEVDSASVLGLVGNTGASTGKHLHFEVSVGGYPVDPIKVISTAQHVQQAKR